MSLPDNTSWPAIGPLPGSIAIAGAWGYIGRRFLDVALEQGLTTYVFDPGPAPKGVDLSRLIRVPDEVDFYRLDADLFHLAVHPEHRRADLLLEREEPLLILNEKPMAEPQRPERRGQIVEAVDASPAIMFYDFPELFEPLTDRILDYLGQFREVQISEFLVERSKDREDPGNPRNSKRMVTIQYQETVHCLAFVLHVLTALKGGVRNVLERGLRMDARAVTYEPPNPEAYPIPVDGRCEFQASMAGVEVRGYTDFKRNSAWAKRRVIKGHGDGIPFTIEASYLEGKKSLQINGIDQGYDPGASSYLHVLSTALRWARSFDRATLMEGPFPNPRFTHVTYQLSGALWRSSRDRREVSFGDFDELMSAH